MDRDDLVAGCVLAVAEHDPRSAMRDVLERALADVRLAADLGTAGPGLNILSNADDLTVLNVRWPPLVSLFPHDHRMWAAIAIYGGREVNSFYRRQGSTLVASGGRDLDEGDVLLLGDETIHAVDNPTRAYTGAIHVYGGDFIATPRSQWDAATLQEAPFDLKAVRSEFERAEQRFNASNC